LALGGTASNVFFFGVGKVVWWWWWWWWWTNEL